MTSRPRFSRLALLLVWAMLAPLLVGCAHSTRVESFPSGAEVYADGEYVGETPVKLESNTGPVTHTRVEVRHEDRAARFDMMRESWSGMGILAAVGLGATTFVVGNLSLIGFLSAYATTAVMAATGGGTAGLGASGVATGMVAAIFLYAVGYTLILSTPLVAALAAGELGRAHPDRVTVDFENEEITSNPSSLVVPLKGATSGYRPLKLRETDAD